MKKEIPGPSKKYTVIMRETSDMKLEEIVMGVRRRTGKNITRSGILDRLISSADVKALVTAIAKEMGE